jgi:hypothetical protein
MAAPKVHETGGGDFKLVEPGTYPAVCTWIVGIGPQPTPWGAKEKIKLRFEIPSERIEYEKDGQRLEGPAVMWATYTASLSKKAILRADLEAWRGKPFTDDELRGFDLNKVLGAPCMLSVVHRKADNGRVYDEIASIGRLTKGIPVPEPEGELIGFDIRDHTAAEYEALPEWCQRKVDDGLAEIKAQEELAAAQAEALAGQRADERSAFTDDDIPF